MAKRRLTEVEKQAERMEASALGRGLHYRTPFDVFGTLWNPRYYATLEEARDARDHVLAGEGASGHPRPWRAAWVECYSQAEGWKPVPGERREREGEDRE